MRTHTFGTKFILAAMAGDLVYTTCDFAALIAESTPKWHGLPAGIVASDVLMIIVMAALQLPVIALIALPFSLAAYAFQRHTGFRSKYVFIATGALIGFACAVIAFWTVYSYFSDEPGSADSMRLYNEIGPFSIIGGAFGGFIYWRRASKELNA